MDVPNYFCILILMTAISIYLFGMVITLVKYRTIDIVFALVWPPALFFYLTRDFWKR